jgi:poly(A) polymerase
VYRFLGELGDAATDTLFFSLADHLATRGSNLDLTNWRYHANIVACVLSEGAREAKAVTPVLLNGHDLQREFGLLPGPRLGELLAELREAQAAGEVGSRDEALKHIERIIEQARG